MRNVFSVLCCPGCKQEGVQLEEICERKQGVTVAFRLKCSTCLWEHQFPLSCYTNVPGKKAKNNMEVIVRLIMTLQNLGIGYDGLLHFCTMLMTRNNYNRTVNSLHDSYMAEAEQSIKIAAEEITAKDIQQTLLQALMDRGKNQKKTHSTICVLKAAAHGVDGEAMWPILLHSKKGLPPANVEIIEPIYEALSEESLLSLCLDSYTQNPNESLNNLIWKRCPKKIYQGKKIVELCTASAVTQFNDGASSIAGVLKRMGIIPGKKHHGSCLKN
eukprot:gene5685-10929_t